MHTDRRFPEISIRLHVASSLKCPGFIRQVAYLDVTFHSDTHYFAVYTRVLSRWLFLEEKPFDLHCIFIIAQLGRYFGGLGPPQIVRSLLKTKFVFIVDIIK